MEFKILDIAIQNRERRPFYVMLEIATPADEVDYYGETFSLDMAVGIRHLKTFKAFQEAARIALGRILTNPFEGDDPLVALENWDYLIDSTFASRASREQVAKPENIDCDEVEIVF